MEKKLLPMKARIHLEKMQAHDFEAFLTMTGNEKVMEKITGRTLTKEEALDKFSSLLENNRIHESFGSYLVLDVTASKMLGFAKLEITKEKPDEAELGFMLLPEFWGMGFGGEIAGLLMRVAESDPDLIRVYANIDPNNSASRKILLGLGFVSELLGEIDGLPSEILGKRLK
jgi:RimJ/RimL family protein N-acetyltransferase